MESTGKKQECHVPFGENQPEFSSFFEFIRELATVLKLQAGNLPGSLFKNRPGLDPFFRETICLAVTFANNCRQ